MSSTRILLVVKHTTLQRLGDADRARLVAAGVADDERLRAAHHQHQQTVDQVRAAIGQHLTRCCWVGDCRESDCAGVDLVVCVGGDGTVLGVQRWLQQQPLLAVNSDPERSVGHFTRLHAEQASATIRAWLGGHQPSEALPRLAVSIVADAGRGEILLDCHPVLNDCLFTNSNPAEMTRYRIDDGQRRELHYSSGVWIATAAGSTAAILSAGLDHRCPSDQAALLFKVREPYSREPLVLDHGVQVPPRGLTITAALPGMQIYIDGAHTAHAVPPGCQVQIQAHTQPLRLALPLTAP